MSWQACANAKLITSFSDGSSLSPTDKCVLMLLAEYCNPETGNAYPTIATLATYSCMEERSVSRILARLKAGGVVEVIPRQDSRGLSLPNFYRIPPQGGYPDSPVTPTPDPPVTQTYSKQPTKEILNESPIAEWVPKDLWEAFLEMRKKIKKPPTPFAKKLLIGQLEKQRKLGGNVAAIIEQSIRNNWQDFYPVKEQSTSLFGKSEPEPRRIKNTVGIPRD
jgi:hypothetical protein